VIVGIIIFISLTFIFGDEYIPTKEVNKNGGIWAHELAEKIGLQTGDQIIKINGKEFEDFQQVIKPEVLLSQNGFYTILRDGKELTIKIPADFIETINSKEAAGNFISPRYLAIIGDVQKGSLANRVGLQANDEFIQIDGVPVKYQDEVKKVLRSKKRDSLSFQVKRGSEVLSFKEYFKNDSTIGFLPKEWDKSKLATINYSFGESIPVGTKRAFGVVFVQLQAFKKIFSGDISVRKSLSGPIGIAKAYGGTWDWFRFWSLTGLLSMVLAFMNLLPIPALDGGHVVFLTYEMISRSKPSDKFLETAQKVGMVFLLVLMVFIFGNDILKLFGL
ncbi:MAG TPA: RIP metalloprotease RseP, partial [Cyclobacteriaceae bacterium]